MANYAEMKPKDTISASDIAFGPQDISDWLPPMKDIPEELKVRDYKNPWVLLVSHWFYCGLEKGDAPAAKAGVDGRRALAHVGCCLQSFEPPQEWKIAGCAYLMSLWFEMPVTQREVK